MACQQLRSIKALWDKARKKGKISQAGSSLTRAGNFASGEDQGKEVVGDPALL